MLGAIWAQSLDGVIGDGTDMPWHIPEDLAHFKAVTLNHPVIMGRRTWESLPARFRPLPGRENMVVTTKQPGEWSTGATLIDASTARTFPDGWVMGGGQLYTSTLDVVSRLEVTIIDAHLADVVPTPVFAPAIGDGFHEVSDSGWLTSSAGRLTGVDSQPVRYRFISYERKDN